MIHWLLTSWMLLLLGVQSGGGFDRAIDRVCPRVVKLYGLGAGLQAGFGSGVLVSQDGLVLTVYSVLIEARRVRAIDSTGREFDVKVVASDPERQLALLRLTSRYAHETPELVFPYFDLSKEVVLDPGDWVLAAGNAFKIAQGSELVSLTHGVFSARTQLDARRRLRDFSYRGDVLVIDAITSNPGAPGGAVVNLHGDFVGMIGRAVISNFTHTHFNYAIPRDVLFDFLEQVGDGDAGTGSLVDALRRRRLEALRREKRPDSGIRLSKVGYRQVLPFVDRVVRGSPADLAGVRKDDLILSINGRSVADIESFKKQLNRLEPTESLSLVLRRGQSILNVRVSFGDS